MKLKPAGGQPSIVKRQGLWVHTGKLPPGFDAVQAIRGDREERIRKLAGSPCDAVQPLPDAPA